MPLSITTSSDYLSLECNRYLSILYKIIGDDLTELVRELLQHSITDSQVEDFYNAVRGQFKYRFTQREKQLIISAAGTGYQHLDITFLLKLLRHCPGNYRFEKQIASLTSIRNELAHLPNTEITQSQFDSYFEKCCDIASALEKYLKRPKSLVQKFQRIYEVNTSSKDGRIDLQVERIKYSLAELKSSEDIINNSEFNKRLEFLEECICQIDRQTDERHRQVIYLKKCAQQVKKKMDSPEQAQCFLTAQGTKPCIDSESLKYRQEEYNNKTRRDPVVDKTNLLIKKVEEESCEGQTTFKHTLPSYRLQPHLESLKACEDFGIRKCNERNSSVIGTFEHPIAFPTIKSKSMDRISLNRLDPSVVYLRSATNDRCKLAHSSSSYVGITENNSILVSQSPSVDTVSQISVKERGTNLSQRKSEDGTLLSTNKKEDHRIRQLTNPQIKEGDSLAKPHTHEGKKLPTIMNKNHNEYFSKPATERKITVAPEQRKAQLPSRYFIPFTKTVAYSKSAVVFPKNIKNQFLTRQLSKLHSCKTTNEISMMAKRLSGFPLNDKKLFEAVCLLMRNRKRKKRKERTDRLSDLGVDWRMDAKELNEELEDEIPTDLDSCCRTAVVLYNDEIHENAEKFQRELNSRVPGANIELQDEVCLPGKYTLDVSPYFTKQYIFVLLSQYYKHSVVQYKVNECLCMSLKDKIKRGRVIPVLMTKEDELPDELLPIEPVEYYDENSLKRLLLLFKPRLHRSISY